ncbi:MAG TPA: hypothetical protein VMS12_03945 [Thermoanaerobaculia bacterium]|nr:hypothetical protein [Thermoanaerobaculia bacterium]
MRPVTGIFLTVMMACAVSALAADARGTAMAQSEPHGMQPADDKPAWRWTTEERLAVRFDPSRIAERRLEYQDSSSSSGAEAAKGTDAPATSGHALTIDGKRHPEIFLPHELFDVLMRGFMPDRELRERQLKSFRAGIVSFGFDESDFWSQLYLVANQYVDYKYRIITSRSESDEKCRAAFAALNGARLLFGQDRFDQFLYEVIAPGTWSSSATNAIDPSADVRRVAEGCR